jgi:hypothetical protein
MHVCVAQVSKLIETVVMGRDSGFEPGWMGLQRSHQDPARHILRTIDAPVDDFLMQKYGKSF